MTFCIIILAIVALIIVSNSSKASATAKGVTMAITGTLIIVGLMTMYGVALKAKDVPVNNGQGFTQESVAKVVSVTHAMGEGKYIVELDKGTYKTSEEYDVYEDAPLVKESTAKIVETGFSKMPVMNWQTPWEYHREHVDIIHFPANEIKVVP